MVSNGVYYSLVTCVTRKQTLRSLSLSYQKSRDARLVSSCRDDGSGLNNFTGDDEDAEGHETLLRYEAPTTHTQKVVPPPVAPKPVLKSQPVQEESDDDTFNDIDIPDLGDK